MQFYPSGTRIAGRYEIVGRPLVGGMGVVYLCFDYEAQRPVALKTFKPEYLPDRVARERFLEEGNTWVRLGKHPHIVRCYQVFQDSPRPEVYLALELVAKEVGRRDASLRAWLTPGRPLPVDQALLIALQIARGLRHATETIPGFVHRDLKPENVLVGADWLSNVAINRVRVTDFGLVKGLRAEQAPDARVGTPAYMSPEQWEGAHVSVQADIYALGCVVGEMLTGRLLVQGETLDALRRAHQDGEAWAAVRAAPSELHEFLGRCLAVDRGQRYAGWEAVEAAIAAGYRVTSGQPPPGLEAVAASSRADRVAVGWSASEIGFSYLEMGNAQAALGYFQRAQQAGQAEGARRLEAAGLNHMGLACAGLGDARHASGYHEQALAIHREIGNRRGEGNALGNLGDAYLRLGDAQRAIGYFEQALVTDREIGDRAGEGADLSSLGEAHRQLGDARRAIGYCEQSLAISREIGNRRGEGNILGTLGSAYLGLGDARRAIGSYERALAIFHEISERRGEGTSLCNLGSVYLQLGDARRAIGYYEQALAIRREIGDRLGEGYDLGNLGVAYQDLGDALQAIGYYEQSLAIRREIGDLNGVATDSFNIALLHAQQGDHRQALPLAQEAARLWSQMGHAVYAQRAQQLVQQLEGDQGPGPAPSQILERFGPLIDAAVTAAHGDRRARSQVESTFDQLTQNGWRIAEPIRRIWAGERDAATLTAGLDESDSLIVCEILKRL